MKRRLFQFHLSTLLLTAWMFGVLMTVQYYRYRALDLDARLEMFANPAKSPNPAKAVESPYFGLYDGWNPAQSTVSPEFIALQKRLKFEVWWRSQIYGFLLPREWLVFISVPMLTAVLAEYFARRATREMGTANREPHGVEKTNDKCKSPR